MIDRYMTPEMALLWNGEDELVRLCRAAEVCAYVSGGQELATAVAAVCGHSDVNIVLWRELEEAYDHDIAAFVEMVRRALPEGPLRDQWHRRRTSSDLVEISLALAVRESLKCIELAKDRLAVALAKLARAHQNSPVMGRTHGQLAEPTTIGRKFAIHAQAMHAWYPTQYEVGKVSGPVGTDTFPGDANILAQLGLIAVPSTQIVPRWYLADSISSLLALQVQVSSLATEIRLAAQSGIGWLRERSPSELARGSSAMPHKRNPIRSERAVGLLKVARHSVYAVVDASAELWNERDISHSSVERTALVDALALTHFVIEDMTGVVERLEVSKFRASAHTHDPTGVGVVEALVRGGMPYSTAYDQVRALGPDHVARMHDVDGAGLQYDPASEPRLWSIVLDLARQSEPMVD